MRYDALREPDDAGDRAGVVPGEHDTRRLDRDVGSRADREADVGAGEGRGVVHAVADHRDREAAGLELGDLVLLVLGQHLGEHLVDAELGGDGVRDRAGVAGDHRDRRDAHRVQVGDGLARFGADARPRARRRR